MKNIAWDRINNLLELVSPSNKYGIALMLDNNIIANKAGKSLVVSLHMDMGKSIIGGNKLEGEATFKPPANRFSLYFTDQRQVMLQEEELPKMGDNQVLVETLISAISPGTESLIYRGEFPGNISVDADIVSLPKKFSYPMKYGYSAVGRVVDTGKDVDSKWKDSLVLAFNPHES